MGLSICAASPALQPLGSDSKARRSALLARFDAARFTPAMLGRLSRPSLRFLGRPRSMMLADSDWPRRWPSGAVWPLRGSVSALGVAWMSGLVSLGVVTVV